LEKVVPEKDSFSKALSAMKAKAMSQQEEVSEHSVDIQWTFSEDSVNIQ
jgi:hypothetical protein